jgi:hypothetical protein
LGKWGRKAGGSLKKSAGVPRGGIGRHTECACGRLLEHLDFTLAV